MSAARRKIRRRSRRQKRRRPLSLTAWRAVIAGQARRDLARHGRLFALAALVLNEAAEVRDAAIAAELAALGAGAAEDAVRRRLQWDHRLETWRQVAEIHGKPWPGPLKSDAAEGCTQ